MLEATLDLLPLPKSVDIWLLMGPAKIQDFSELCEPLGSTQTVTYKVSVCIFKAEQNVLVTNSKFILCG